MSYLGKNISNRFPSWSKIKKDESSIGAIICDQIGRSLEKTRQTGLNFSIQKKVLENIQLLHEYSNYKITLPNYPIDISKKQIELLEITSVKGVLDLFTSWSEYNLSLPKRYIFESKYISKNIIFENIVNESNSSFEENIDFELSPTYLLVDASEIEYFYNNKTKYLIENAEKSKENYYVTIRGKDLLNKSIEETIFIEKRKVYRTKNLFTKICSLKKDDLFIKQRKIVGGASIETNGIFGKIKIKKNNSGLKKIILEDTVSVVDYNPFAIVYPEESYTENHLKIVLNEKYELESYHSFFNEEYKYYSKDNIYSEEIAEELLCSQKLTNTIGAPVVVRNIAYNEVNKKLYGINNAGRLFVWNLERPKFNWGNRLNESKEIEISLESDKKYYKGNETALIRVVLSRPKDEIKSFYIFRYKPSSLNTETEWDVQFLLHDRNWTDEISSFEGNNRFDEFENIINIGFKDTLDEYGQYDYFVLSSKQNINFDSKIDFRNKIIKLINEESNGVYCNKTSIIVPKLKAEKEYVLDNLPQLKINQEYKIFFSNLKNELCLQVDEEVYLYKNLDSKVYMNYSQGIIMTKDVENNLSVNINFTDGTSYQCEVNYE